MKRVNTTLISGMQEFLPPRQAKFDDFLARICEVFQKHGFMHIETPAIERMEILLAKAGGETEKQIYKVMKTAETGEEADQGLRFDHTVPLARYVVEHEGKLSFPFKAMQIGRSWRGERAQKGRFREFYQCDVDVIGRGKLDAAYDAEVIATLVQALLALELETPVVARISNRKLLMGFLRELGLIEQAQKICRIIDHAEKISYEEVRYALTELGLGNDEVKKITHFMELRGVPEEVLKGLERLKIQDEMFGEGVYELKRLTKLLEEEQLIGHIEVDLKIVRGLDYYTGTVFEFGLPEYKQVGSIGGGGRYENLAGYFSEQKFPGVGGSIGLSRLFDIILDNNLVKSQVGKPLDYAVVPISEQEVSYANKVARDLRGEGFRVTVVLTDKRLGDKLAYAARLADNAVVVGEKEARTGEHEVKRFN